MKQLIILFISSILLFLRCDNHIVNNTSVLYHEVKISASSVKLIKFNVNDYHGKSYVKEIIDSIGRVKELRFYNSSNELSYTGSGFYGGPIVRYDYKDNMIIETFFETNSEIAHDFCCSEVPYKHIYVLNDNKEIIDIELIYKIDFKWSKTSFEKAQSLLEFYKEFPDESSELKSVFGYGFSFSKLNGINPKKD